MTYDVVVVGGGTAGCVVAARLSEDEDCSVLLVEAGPDYPDVDSLPADVRDAARPTVEHDWGFLADSQLDRGFSVPRGKIMGGCSSTNACFAQRGVPQDYDGWYELGNPGWAFRDVLEDFRRLESDADFSGPWHGADGPVPIRRHPRSELNAVQLAFLDGAVAVGHKLIDDHNEPGVVGVGLSPRNVRDGERMSAAVTHLSSARRRANLTIRPETTVDSVHIESGRATGIRLVDGSLVQSRRVVLAAGAYASPSILMRSGVGPARDLERLGIRSVVDLPGVGANLSDHALLSIDLPTRPSAGHSRFAVHATWRSSVAEPAGPADIMLFTAGPFDADADQVPGGAVFGIVVGLMAPRSRGWVRLTSKSPMDPPQIHFGHLAEPEDLEAMLDGLAEARRIAASGAMRTISTGDEMSPGESAPPGDRQALAEWALSEVATFHHPVGTCSMGSSPKRGAVTDAKGSVHGVAGLTVVDASIMPTVPRGTPNIPVMMAAEHVARWLSGA